MTSATGTPRPLRTPTTVRAPRIVRAVAAVAFASSTLLAGAGGALAVADQQGTVTVRPDLIGDMTPTYNIGDRLILRPTPATQVQVDDIVEVESLPGQHVTHRVAAVAESATEGERYLTVQADRPVSSAAPAAGIYPATTVDRLAAVIPAELVFLTTWPIWAGAAALSLGVLLVLTARIRKARRTARKGRRAATPVTA